ncbi:AraC family transcriptional regulator [Dyadobacter sp. Leaf189]|uniref:helix-turn-helix domain-containing protein n=1 Tax=Dyadobacter sp. Leaf189 TaxID=1736295 RepID=UPI0009E96C0E|nr:helix-turn-helix domain-containing protein [Dyadobacter sp. Leaf189]
MLETRQPLPVKVPSPTIAAQTTQFRVSGANEQSCDLGSYNRRDFYKISLIIEGDSQLLYANRGIVIDRSALVFTNPLVPYSWEATKPQFDCFFCVFTQEFLRAGNRMESFQESVLFKPGGEPVYFLDDDQVSYLRGIFQRMCREMESDYIYKYDLLRNHVNLIIHEAIKMQPAVAYFNPPNAAARISKLFLTLLEKQFPVESPQHSISLKKASEYASQLSVHVNHLNAAVQEVTGKSTTAHINERILTEAKSLLTHTDWSVAEIAFSLGFEYASYFNNFFKRHAGTTPLAIRKSL